ncbi:membrane-spanning 4-domains subfamily A member 4A-like [Heteronotia binoei]|uniref:membrane-spanning 4-domains subfamily A member 4A-like n=1 Tax=Heteronotia binoei TaxID=13085 RepID=UPI0029318698|nr:membrane-spanning 4-domains subfamily A member 4A-like [Heteronotia binoei]XP_060117980.1 membrane-spanning 4-domains subfamily A member 4A-like [Heteronotia binoei]XP_060119449.1 membrane-spanning 4-domains subfamily A member 4A-like [Heteronotia binoei]XP_060119450.1 membrane-spanning 4-domains subfamily A member 4A-like [Heteronotia binoei]
MLETAPLLQKFLGVQPRAFGAVLVVLGLLHVAFGILFLPSECSYTDGVGIHFFSGILLFLAGVVAVIADRHPSIGMVKACLVFQIMAAAVAVVINFLYVRDILYYMWNICTLSDEINGCRVRDQILRYCTGIRGIAFLTGTLGICLTISLAAFACRTVCY